MFIDARQIPTGQTLRTGVCVVGAGPMGILVARALADAGVDVTLVESGGFELDAETQALASGEVAGDLPRLRASYLSESRLRLLGGTSGHWAGQMRPLDRVDFEARDYIPHSGWPFPRDRLEPFYEAVRALLGLGPFDDGATPDFPAPNAVVFTRDHPLVVAKGFQYNPLRFGRVFRDELRLSPRLTVLLHANVVELETTPNGAALSGTRVATLTGRHFRVAAPRFVLAAGGIENARLLLASNRVWRNGVGNAHDLVGRCFMEHLHVYDGLGSLAIWRDKVPRLYMPDRASLFYPSDQLARRERMAGVGLNLVEQKVALEEADRHLLMAAEDLDRGLDHEAPRHGAAAPSLRSFNALCEQVPNLESRVMLSQSRDALGMPRVRLQWRLDARDLDALDRFLDVFSRELARARLGRARRVARRADLPGLVMGGSHHMGTTRMHDDPKRGVVDRDCRVHGVDNLYVAGTAVFPTSGAVNPTFTGMALSLRLAAHLLERRR